MGERVRRIDNLDVPLAGAIALQPLPHHLVGIDLQDRSQPQPQQVKARETLEMGGRRVRTWKHTRYVGIAFVPS